VHRSVPPFEARSRTTATRLGAFWGPLLYRRSGGAPCRTRTAPPHYRTLSLGPPVRSQPSACSPPWRVASNPGSRARQCATICRRRPVRECRSASRRRPRTPAGRIPAAQSGACGDAADRRPRPRRGRCARRACLSWSPRCAEGHWRRRARSSLEGSVAVSGQHSGHTYPVNRWAGVSVGVSLEGGRSRHLRYHNPAGHADCQRVNALVSDFTARPGRSPGVCLQPLGHLSQLFQR
jgi:hypothetical protein